VYIGFLAARQQETELNISIVSRISYVSERPKIRFTMIAMASDDVDLNNQAANNGNNNSNRNNDDEEDDRFADEYFSLSF
jgi:hypothetical protein